MVADFHPLEKRHLAVRIGEMFSSFKEEKGWLCGFKDVNPNAFGFVPKIYLKFDHETKSATVTPRGNVAKPAANVSNDVSPHALDEQVRSFLDDIYSAAD